MQGTIEYWHYSYSRFPIQFARDVFRFIRRNINNQWMNLELRTAIKITPMIKTILISFVSSLTILAAIFDHVGNALPVQLSRLFDDLAFPGWLEL